MFLWWRIPRRFYRAIPSTFTVDIVFCCALDSIRFKPSRNFIRTDSEMIIISDKKQKWRRVSRGISCHGNRCAWPWQRPTTLPPPDWPSQFLEICQSTCTDSLPWQRPATPRLTLSILWNGPIDFCHVISRQSVVGSSTSQLTSCTFGLICRWDV